MADTKIFEPRFPLGGVVRRLANWDAVALSDKPYTPWAMNCRPEDPFEGRLRGGSRPGIQPYLYDDQPEWPTGVLEDENGVAVTTEAGDPIYVPITGAAALAPEIRAAMQAYGYGELNEALDSSVGTAPTGCTMGCYYRDRLVVAGAQIIHMSRQGNHGDWNYGADVEDAGRAFVFQLAECTEVGDTVTAIVSHKDSALIAATEHGLWAMRGDPVDDGSLQNVSRDVGIVSKTAWTKMGDSLFFLSRDGLYVVGMDGSGLKNVSGDRLPSELHDIDLTMTSVRMGYSHLQNGVYLFLEGSPWGWFFDTNAGGFWPFRLPITVEAAFIVDGQLLVKDDDDAVWTLDCEDDNGTDISSHVLLGPFRAAESPAMFANITLLNGAVEVEPDGIVTWRIVTGNTAQSAIDLATDAVNNWLDGDTTTALSVVKAIGTWRDGRSGMAHPRVRGAWVMIWLHSDSVWAFDDMLMEMAPVGNWR